MSKLYKLIFKQIQPIHIGMGNYGVVNETRIFIPGWTMWGALTNFLGILEGWNDQDYKSNKSVFEKISCFYPCFEKTGNQENIFFPVYENGEFGFKSEQKDFYSENKFRAEFVDTFVSTAILPESRSAKEESLHEIDILLPQPKKDFVGTAGGNQLYWVGYLDIEDGLLEKINEIFVGGDRRYGLGLMILEAFDEVSSDLFEKQINEEITLMNFLEIKKGDNSDFFVQGETELIVTKDYLSNNHESLKSKHCLTPGSKIKGFERNLCRGIWS
jgi:hypothetical protein